MLRPIFIVGFIGMLVLVSNGQRALARGDQARLNTMIAQHRRVRSRLPIPDQQLLGRLTAQVRKRLFGDLPRTNLRGYTETMLRNGIPSLTDDEAGSLAEYVLGGIAGNDPLGSVAGGSDPAELRSASKQMQETQMSFNLQYLQLQNQMQNENRQYTAVSNIMKTKHDTVKNSISNIR